MYEMEKLSSICIITRSGRTYTFKNVTITSDDETVIQFSYSAESDGRVKTAIFLKATLCGWLLCRK